MYVHVCTSLASFGLTLGHLAHSYNLSCLEKKGPGTGQRFAATDKHVLITHVNSPYVFLYVCSSNSPACQSLQMSGCCVTGVCDGTGAAAHFQSFHWHCQICSSRWPPCSCSPGQNPICVNAKRSHLRRSVSHLFLFFLKKAIFIHAFNYKIQ